MIVGMMAMMEICIRVRDRRSPYTISAIGLGGSNRGRRRQFLIGKLVNGIEHGNGRNSESLPIYSVLDSSISSTSSCTYHRSGPDVIASETTIIRSIRPTTNGNTYINGNSDSDRSSCSCSVIGSSSLSFSIVILN